MVNTILYFVALPKEAFLDQTLIFQGSMTGVFFGLGGYFWAKAMRYGPGGAGQALMTSQ